MLLASESIPVSVMREPGFVDWIVYALAVLFIANIVKGWIVPAKREISGSIESKPAKEHADKAEFVQLKKSVDDMRTEITAQFNNARLAGEARVAAIAQDIDAQVGTLSLNVGKLTDLITKALVDNAAQGQAINDLKANHHTHQRQVEAIQKHIAELLMRKPSSR